MASKAPKNVSGAQWRVVNQWRRLNAPRGASCAPYPGSHPRVVVYAVGGGYAIATLMESDAATMAQLDAALERAEGKR